MGWPRSLTLSQLISSGGGGAATMTGHQVAIGMAATQVYGDDEGIDGSAITPTLVYDDSAGQTLSYDLAGIAALNIPIGCMAICDMPCEHLTSRTPAVRYE